MDALPTETTSAVLDRDGLQALIEALAARGYRVVGPVLRDGAIVHDEVAGVADLPAGWTDRQGPGHYRLEQRADRALFGFTGTPQSWKRFLHPPVETLWRARQEEGGLLFTTAAEAMPRYAFLGVRACDLHAIAIQDRVFCQGDYRDTAYEQRRREAFVVALNCSEAGDTCFCVSMGGGPKAEGAFDLALTELLDEHRHEFLVEVGSAAGAEVLSGLPQRPATQADRVASEAVVARTAAGMGRTLETAGLQALLQDNPEHPRWAEVAERCLACANCTMVCPTCFCTTVEDHGDLSGGAAERVRLWDSCFTLDFSYIHGGSVRQSDKGRYRQWMTHKLSTWIDQFGSSGCVGCGRCITWCPVGIDITEEAAAIRAAPRAKGGSHGES